jgi:hypothetical protein
MALTSLGAAPTRDSGGWTRIERAHTGRVRPHRDDSSVTAATLEPRSGRSRSTTIGRLVPR